jgi:hypothetical protein
MHYGIWIRNVNIKEIIEQHKNATCIAKLEERVRKGIKNKELQFLHHKA